MFGCIGLLQIAPGRFAVPLLVTMHVGILSFAKLKRSLADDHPELARVARVTWGLMAMYLPILLYKLLGRLDLIRVDHNIILGATLALSVPAALLVGFTVFRIGFRARQ